MNEVMEESDYLITGQKVVKGNKQRFKSSGICEQSKQEVWNLTDQEMENCYTYLLVQMAEIATVPRKRGKKGRIRYSSWVRFYYVLSQ